MGRKAPRKVTEKKMPTFFQLIHPSLTTEDLRIPPKFTLKYIPNNLPEWATLKLEGSSEGSWSVKVWKSGRDVYLKEGWQEFLRDNSLGDKEFLVFIYHGEMLFSIEIFKKNGCRRMGFHNICSKENSVLNSPKRPRGRPRKCSKADTADKGIREVKEEEEEEEDYSDNPAELCKLEERQFTTTVYEPYKVRIPKSFSNQHQYFSPGQYELSLKNSKGKWDVNIVKYSRCFYVSTGWKAFAEASQIKDRDVCTFELVSERRLVVVRICGK